MRVVIDTNVLISARIINVSDFLNQPSKPNELKRFIPWNAKAIPLGPNQPN